MKHLNEIKKPFKNKELFDQALTHRSWKNENRGVRGQNERLEFLGDAVLELVVSNHIYHKLPDKPEGILTMLRGKIVNTVNLSEVAIKLKLGEALFLGKGEEQEGGRTNSSLLANTVEAVIGAIYVDQGYAVAEEFIKNNILADLEEKLNQPLKDPKSRLQEIVQSNGQSAPRYVVKEEQGPDHNKTYVVRADVEGKTIGTGTGKNKSLAEQAAASSALASLSTKG